MNNIMDILRITFYLLDKNLYHEVQDNHVKTRVIAI